MSDVDPSLLAKVVKSLSEPPVDAPAGTVGSILTAAASSYASRPLDEDVTIPTGFDPNAAALFEALIEAAYLVANADGHFDATERQAFESVVSQSSGQQGVTERQIEALISDLAEQLAEDGIEKRCVMVGRTVQRADHQHEVLRMAALLASISGGVADVEREVLVRLAKEFSLPAESVTTVLDEVHQALGLGT
jgi:tellurite resistance protein